MQARHCNIQIPLEEPVEKFEFDTMVKTTVTSRNNDN
jgi:hypothetical protein